MILWQKLAEPERQPGGAKGVDIAERRAELRRDVKIETRQVVPGGKC